MATAADPKGNFISEWFGHRVYPKVVSNQASIEDQRAQRCPFLSLARAQTEDCVKPRASKGVCTISSSSNGPRQDWVVCPYRAFDKNMMTDIARRMFDLPTGPVHIYAAPLMREGANQVRVLDQLGRGENVFIYFDHKLGGEIQLSPTSRSPQMAFDTTFVSLAVSGNQVLLGRFGIFEIQTMDFHGSYKAAVEKLRAALELHPANFPEMVAANPWWLSDKIEGPNIANVFKRTFYQLMFKFEIATSAACAGCVLAIPCSVWDSWQRFLGEPELRVSPDGVIELVASELEYSDIDIGEVGTRGPSWIYVFDFDESSEITPSPMRIKHIVSTTAGVLARHALERAPKAALTQLETTLYPTLKRRLQKYWGTSIGIPDFILK